MKKLAVPLLLLTHLLLSYGGSETYPVRALAGTLILAAIARAAWPEQWRTLLGLCGRRREWGMAAAAAPALMALLYVLIRDITQAQGITYQTALERYGLLSAAYLHTLGQTLNEELLLGALLLNGLQIKFPRARRLVLAAATALAFSGLHYWFYRWVVSAKHMAALSLGTLFVLFAVGMLRNTLILKTGHIALAWSLHLSINLAGLAGQYRHANGNRLGEGEIFNLILGSLQAVILGVVIVAVCAGVLLLGKEAAQIPPGNREGPDPAA